MPPSNDPATASQQLGPTARELHDVNQSLGNLETLVVDVELKVHDMQAVRVRDVLQINKNFRKLDRSVKKLQTAINKTQPKRLRQPDPVAKRRSIRDSTKLQRNAGLRTPPVHKGRSRQTRETGRGRLAYAAY